MNTPIFKEFSEEQQAEYQKYAEEHWDSHLVQQSYTRWNGLNPEQRKTLLADGQRITLAFVDAMPDGAESETAQLTAARWHYYIKRFYDCSYDIFAELGKMYLQDARFADFYRGVHPQLPEFLAETISIYCKKHNSG